MDKLIESRTNWKYLIFILILAVLVGGGILVYDWWVMKLGEYPEFDMTSNLKSYKSEKYGFAIKYPEEIILSEESNGINLTHSITYEHPNPCDFKGDNPALQELTDFNVSLEVFQKNLLETVVENENSTFAQEYLVGNKLKIAPGFIDEFIIGKLKGYQITQGVEGCGEYTYYFPIDSSHTLLVKRAFIAEFSPVIADSQKYLALPGIISPMMEKTMFDQIFSDFRLLN
jgi:hypothetical protein